MKLYVRRSVNLLDGEEVPGLPKLPKDVWLGKPTDNNRTTLHLARHTGANLNPTETLCRPVDHAKPWIRSIDVEPVYELFGGVFRGKTVRYTICNACLKALDKEGVDDD